MRSKFKLLIRYFFRKKRKEEKTLNNCTSLELLNYNKLIPTGCKIVCASKTSFVHPVCLMKVVFNTLASFLSLFFIHSFDLVFSFSNSLLLLYVLLEKCFINSLELRHVRFCTLLRSLFGKWADLITNQTTTYVIISSCTTKPQKKEK